MPEDVLGRDDELGSIEAFLDRPAAASPALVLEGEAGIGKSTLWLGGVEAARERGVRVLSARPAELELGVGYAGLGDVLEDALGDVLPDLATPRRRALEKILLVADGAGAAVDFRTVAVAVRSALHVRRSSRLWPVSRPSVPRAGGGCRALPRRAHRREPPHAHLLQAGRALADGACGQSSDVLTFPPRRLRSSLDDVPSYLVETYLARGDAGGRAACERRARSAAEALTRQGTRVRFDRAIHVPEDEICFFVFDAPSGRDAALAAQRAELDPLRVVGAVSSGSRAERGKTCA